MKISSLEKVLDKIRKLKRHETSARKLGSVEEANAFAHRVTVLLEKYRLEEADIDFSNVGGQLAISQQEVGWGDYGLSPARRRCAWMEDLATAVGRNNGTAILCLQGTNVLTLVGKLAQRVAYQYQQRQAIRAPSHSTAHTLLRNDFQAALDSTACSPAETPSCVVRE